MEYYINLFDYKVPLVLDRDHSSYSTKVYKITDVIGNDGFSRFIRIGNLKNDNIYLSETLDEDEYPYYCIGYLENDEFVAVVEWDANEWEPMVKEEE